MSMEKIIEAHSVSFGYDVQPILKNIDFDLKRGDFTGIIGPNGSGKSTFIKLLLGLLRPSSGELKLFGTPINDFKNWPKIGYVSQKNQLQVGVPASVYEVISANLYAQTGFLHLLSKEQKLKVVKALEIVGLADRIKSTVGSLSGGQQQRVHLARVLVNDPEILLMDEPASGMDTASENAMYELLHKLNDEKGIAIVMVTHDITAVTSHVNRLFCMGSGNMIEHDVSEELDAEFLTGLYGHNVHMHVHSETHKHEGDAHKGEAK